MKKTVLRLRQKGYGQSAACVGMGADSIRSCCDPLQPRCPTPKLRNAKSMQLYRDLLVDKRKQTWIRPKRKPNENYDRSTP